jgi:polyhydroxybutyrate depolymerase
VAIAALACNPSRLEPLPQPVTSPASPPTVDASASAAAQPSAGANELVVGGSRATVVDLPPTTGAEPVPLLVMLHGYGSTGADHESYFRFAASAAARGFAYAHPDGTVDRDGQRFWNATDACCDFESTGVDDSAYLADLVAEVGRTRVIDPKRVYFVGHSNGGFMSYRMACEHADVVAAIVSLAGATFAKRTDCAPSEPVAVLEIHGTADDVVQFRGGRLSDFGAPGDKSAYPGVNATVASWEVYDGCDATVARSATTLDIDAGITTGSRPAETTVDTWTDCAPGGHVELWTIRGGHHSPDLIPGFADAVLDFLAAHPKP